MPVVEKYGLMILFGLCALIVCVGIFAEDPLSKEAQIQGQEFAEKVIEPQAPEERVVFNDSDWTTDPKDEFRPGGLKAFAPPRVDPVGADPDPRRESSLGNLPSNLRDAREGNEPRRVGPKSAPKSEPRLAYRDYTVRKGDSLSRIASKELGHARFAAEIRRANPRIKNDKIFTGKTIRLPILPQSKKAAVAQKDKAKSKAKGRYITVKKNQSLGAIARKYYGAEGKWRALAKRNGIQDPKDLRERQKLFLPADL